MIGKRFALAACLALAPLPASGAPDYFTSVQGVWAGSGNIVNGKYKGTKFTCNLRGAPQRGASMDISGTCRVGLLTQKISARIKRGRNGYRGTFLDGAKGKGLDVVSGNVSGKRATMSMVREELKGAMVARVKDDGKLGITVSVRIGEQLVPVIGIDLTRVDGTATGSVR